MGLGPLHTVSLSEARNAAHEARRLRFQGIDPLEQRQRAQSGGPPPLQVSVQQAPQVTTSMTFAQATDAYIHGNRAAWRNEKHASQWMSTLTTYVFPHCGALSLGDVETKHVLAALEPIWMEKSETASRVRGRMEAVLDWATAHGHRSGDNPARWKGHLDQILPAKSKVSKVTHHAALPFKELPSFTRRLAGVGGVSARALEFAILTAARTGEVIGAEWREIDLTAKVWAIPAARMKAGKEHRVPLSAQAMKVIEWARQRKLTQDAEGQLAGHVFPGMRAGQGLSNMSLLKVLKALGRGDLTTHGFRSTFRDWAAETTDYSSEVVEMALAHTISNKVEAAYRRGDLFEKRRVLMEEWASVCISA